MHLITASKETAVKLYRLLHRFKTHRFSLVANIDPDRLDIFAEARADAFGAGREGYLIQGFVEGFIAAQSTKG
jgi:hypothetical protein